MASQKKIFEVTTPIAGLGTVTLFQGGWDYHIVLNHPEMTGKVAIVEKTLITPCSVHEGNPATNFVFANTTALDAQGKPLMVMVKPNTADGSIVVTAYHATGPLKKPTIYKK